MILSIIIFMLALSLILLALLRAAGEADDHAEIMYDFEEEK